MDVQPHLLNLSAYIDQNLEKDLPLSILAKRVGLSPFHFHRKFGAYFGESLHQHIKRLRLERAAFSLIHGTSPVRQIAKDSGYKTVSAFSHAFSGFAGESPTRYRTIASTTQVRDGAAEQSRLEPAWVGEMPAQEFAFLRAMGSDGDVQRAVDDAVDLIVKLVGPLVQVDGASNGQDRAGHDGDGRDAPAATSFECIVATSDVYGVFKGSDFRIDVGIDAARVPAERSAVLGKQTLPGGRYARFDISCGPGETLDQCRRVSLSGLRKRGETPRLSQYIIRFDAKGESKPDGSADYQLFVPLTN